ncbi:MAG: NAD(P)-binding domain-containing protein [Gemmataceae bacterium]
MTPPLSRSGSSPGPGRWPLPWPKGRLAAGLLDPARSLASDPYPAAGERFATTTGLRVTDSNADVLVAADLLVLAVKPQAMAGLLDEITPWVDRRHLTISIAAGVTLAQLAAGLGADARLIRVMPNTPCLVGASASGFRAGRPPPPMMWLWSSGCSGRLGWRCGCRSRCWTPSPGLSGSGPAFVYVMIEALRPTAA